MCETENNKSCGCSDKKSIPMLAIMTLIIGFVWLLNDMGVIAYKIPWMPLIMILMAINWIIGYYKNQK
jgi:hypothetical protein